MLTMAMAMANIQIFYGPFDHDHSENYAVPLAVDIFLTMIMTKILK